MEKRVYFDNAATTATSPEVVEAMLPYFTQSFGNPSSIYEIGQTNKIALDNARQQVADLINAKPEEIFFTSGATEADNWAIKGIAESYKNKGNHIITSNIEHHAVLHTCEYLEKNGFEVTYLPVDENGLVQVEDLKNAIKDTTILISIMLANNEIGTVQPIKELGEVAREKGIIFHTDAVQAVGQIPIDVEDMNIDMLSLTGHKFNGPKGTGALYVKKGIKIKSFIHGGAQERRRRGGTENVPCIVGLGKAAQLANANMETKIKKLTRLRDKLINDIRAEIPYCKLNGDAVKRLPNNVNFSFEFIEGESLLIMLDMKGICASSGSACTSGSLDPSHVLLGIGLPHEIAHGSLRLTLGDENTEEDVNYLVEVLPSIVKRLRDMSPLYEDFVKNNK